MDGFEDQSPISTKRSGGLRKGKEKRLKEKGRGRKSRRRTKLKQKCLGSRLAFRSLLSSSLFQVECELDLISIWLINHFH